MDGHDALRRRYGVVVAVNTSYVIRGLNAYQEIEVRYERPEDRGAITCWAAFEKDAR